MKCISCDSEKFLEYSKKSCLNITVYQCDKCKLIVTGKTNDERDKAISSIYSNEFWDEQKAIYGNIDDKFSDTISKGKQRDFISQFKFSKPFFQNLKKILFGLLS